MFYIRENITQVNLAKHVVFSSPWRVSAQVNSQLALFEAVKVAGLKQCSELTLGTLLPRVPMTAEAPAPPTRAPIETGRLAPAVCVG